MNKHTIILNEENERWELYRNGKFVAAIWEWYAADEDDAEDIFASHGYIG